jgi:hypothetical protein
MTRICFNYLEFLGNERGIIKFKIMFSYGPSHSREKGLFISFYTFGLLAICPSAYVSAASTGGRISLKFWYFSLSLTCVEKLQVCLNSGIYTKGSPKIRLFYCHQITLYFYNLLKIKINLDKRNNRVCDYVEK